jgi:hypothetical protein
MVARVGFGAFRPGLGHGSRLTRVLERWLIEERLAKQTPGGLIPTGRGLELGGAVEQVAYDLGRGR